MMLPAGQRGSGLSAVFLGLVGIAPWSAVIPARNGNSPKGLVAVLIAAES